MVQRVRLKHAYRTVSRAGKPYWYHRLTGERLPDDEMARARRVLEINGDLEAERTGDIPGTLAHVIDKYLASPEFNGKDRHGRDRLAPATKASYRRCLDRYRRGVGGTWLDRIDVAWCYEVRDALADTPRTADLMLDVLAIVLSFAIKRGLLRGENPARHVDRLRMSKSYDPWPDEALDRFRADGNPRLVWGLEAALFTGQRLGDVLAMQWGDIGGGRIAVAQQKTGERLQIPIHPDLAAVLGQIPRVGVTIVHREDGRAYTTTGFSAMFRRELKRLGIAGLVFHGLRATAAARLAEAGCTDREIMSILGHRTAGMVTKYTRGADQERLATAAITKLESRRKR